MEKDGEEFCKTKMVKRLPVMRSVFFLMVVALMGLTFTSVAQKKKDVEEVPQLEMRLDYSLPKVLFKVDVKLQEIHSVPGPYHSYASSMLGIEPDIVSEGSKWSLSGMSITPFYVPDQACRFSMVSTLENELVQLSVTPDGLLAGVGVTTDYNMPVSGGEAVLNSSDVKTPKLYEVGSFNFLEYIVDSVFVEVKGPRNTVTQQFDPNSPYHYEIKRDTQAVREILDKIYDLRTDRNDLLRGDRELEENVSLSTVLSRYDKLEKEYFALFLGVNDTLEHSYTFYVEPQNIKTGQVVLRISESKGVVSAKESSAKPLILTYGSVMLPQQTAETPMEGDLAYRVAASTTITVSYDNRELTKFNAIIPQWGVIQCFTPLELSRLRLEFYPQYGTLKSAVEK